MFTKLITFSLAGCMLMSICSATTCSKMTTGEPTDCTDDYCVKTVSTQAGITATIYMCSPVAVGSVCPELDSNGMCSCNGTDYCAGKATHVTCTDTLSPGGNGTCRGAFCSKTEQTLLGMTASIYQCLPASVDTECPTMGNMYSCTCNSGDFCAGKDGASATTASILTIVVATMIGVWTR